MTPIECAIADTNSKTMELMRKASVYMRCLRNEMEFNKSAVSSFSMLTSGIVNAAVNGGTKVFQDLFFESELKFERINQRYSSELKQALCDQLKAVKFALMVHEHVMSEEYRPLHVNIQDNFGRMKESLERVIGEIDLAEKPGFGSIPCLDWLGEKEASE
jgi:hypothetical protein